MEESEETPALSAETMRILQEFYAEQATRQESLVTENWQLSQFWYDETTSKILAEEVWNAAAEGDWVACISCPSLYKSLVDLQSSLASKNKKKNLEIYLFEYDERFLEVAGAKFVLYDYKKPTEIPAEFFGKFQFFAIDPPFLSEECLKEVEKSCSFLKKTNVGGAKVLLCTGEVMESAAKNIFNVEKTNFIPKHEKKLSNSFASFTNYCPAHLNNIADHVKE